MKALIRSMIAAAAVLATAGTASAALQDQLIFQGSDPP